MRKLAELNARAVAAYNTGKYSQALALFREAGRQEPENIRTLNNCGVCLLKLGDFLGARELFRHVIRFEPFMVDAYRNLSTCALNLGDHEAAIGWLMSGLDRKCEPVSFSNLLLYTQYTQSVDQLSLFEGAQLYGQRCCPQKPRPRKQLWRQDQCKPGAPVVLGIVSPDFRKHSAAYFLEGLLRGLDPQRFRPLLFIDNPGALDQMTDTLKELADWVDIRGLPDAQVAKKIERLGVQIALDLSGHTADNRLPMFAKRVAPVQISWLGFLGTTGVPAIDFRIVDPWTTVPPELSTERQLIAPDGLHCYTPQTDRPVLPRSSGPIRFCNFGNLAKISGRSRQLWAKVLRAVPDSTLTIMASGFQHSHVRAYWQLLLAGDGIPTNQLKLLEPAFHADYLDTLADQDIWLDTQPYASATTACESTWLGIPVLTQVGPTPTGRLGQSILMSAQIPENIFRTENEYVAQAIHYAKDPLALARFRASARDRLRASPLLDRQRFATTFMELLEEATQWKEY